MSYEAWLENVEDLVKPFPDRLKSFALRQLYNKQKLYQMAYLMQSWGWTMWDGRTVTELQQYAADAEETPVDKVTKVSRTVNFISHPRVMGEEGTYLQRKPCRAPLSCIVAFLSDCWMFLRFTIHVDLHEKL